MAWHLADFEIAIPLMIEFSNAGFSPQFASKTREPDREM
jgi:hypothetical protein